MNITKKDTKHICKLELRTIIGLFVVQFSLSAFAQERPKVLDFSNKINADYLPDFSYVGYAFGEKKLPQGKGNVVLAVDYGVVANDGLGNGVKPEF